MSIVAPALARSNARLAPRARTASARPIALGIDLRSGARYPTGLAILDASRRCLRVAKVRTDAEILEVIGEAAPDIVAIDAPLALPEGRDCADPACGCATFGIMRAVDRLAARQGYRPFPALLPSMVGLTLRGIALLTTLRAEGVPVYFSTDTGPTMVLMLHRDHVVVTAARIRSLGFDCVEGDIAPGAHLIQESQMA